MTRLPITSARLRDFSDDPLGCMLRLRAEHGDLFALEEGSRRLVFALGPEYNRRILTDAERFHSRFFAIRGSRRSAQRRVSAGLLSQNGDEHRTARRTVSEPFQRASIGRYHGRIVELTNELLDGWRVGDVVDVHRAMLDLMLRVTSSILFGVDDPELALRIGGRLDDWMRLNHETGVAAVEERPVLDTRYEDLLERAEEVERDLQKLIAARRGDAGGRDVLSLLLRSGAANDEAIVGQVAILFGAAHVTTAHTLAWTLLLLAQHPHVAEACFDEVRSVVPDAHEPPTDLADVCPLTERVLKESMRILPASAYVHRMTAVPVELGPFQLNPGVPVVWSQFVTHHMESVFPHPRRFDPDRWLTARPSPYEYLPFGAGHRMCIGAMLAMRIQRTVVPLIVRRFRLETVAGSEVEPHVVSTTLGPHGPLPMIVRPARGPFLAAPISGRVHDFIDLPEPAGTRLRAA